MCPLQQVAEDASEPAANPSAKQKLRGWPKSVAQTTKTDAPSSQTPVLNITYTMTLFHGYN